MYIYSVGSRECMYVSMCVCVCVSVCMYYVCMYVRMSVCVCVCAYVYYVYMSVYMRLLGQAVGSDLIHGWCCDAQRRYKCPCCWAARVNSLCVVSCCGAMVRHIGEPDSSLFAVWCLGLS